MADTSATESPVSGSAADLFDSCPVPVLIHEPETGRILDANPAGEALFGYDTEALREMAVSEFSPTMDDVEDQVGTAFETAMRTGQDALDWEITGADGTVTEVWVELRRKTIDGTEVVVTFVTDVTETRKRERILNGLHEVATALLEAETAEAVADITTNAADDVLEVSLASVRLLEDDQLVVASMTTAGEALSDTTPDPIATGEGFIGEAFEGGEPVVYDDISERGHRVDGTNLASAVCIPLGDHGVFAIASETPGQFDDSDREIANLLTRLTTGALDQVGRKRRFQERTNQLEALLNNAPLIFYEVDTDGTILESRGKALAQLGLEAGEAVGMDIFDMYSEFPQVGEAVERALGGNAVKETLFVDGTWFENTFEPVFDDEGDVERVIGIAVDITDVKSLEEQFAALSEAGIALSEQTSEAAAVDEALGIAKRVLEESVVVYWEADHEERTLTVGSMTDQAGVLTEDEDADLVHVEDDPIWQVFEAGDTVTMNEFDPDDAADAADLGSTILAPVGEHGLLTIGAAQPHAYSERDHDLLAILAGVLRTTLDRLAYEHQLETSQVELERSNESLQQFAYVASHDLQEPLRMVSSYVSLLEQEYGDRLDGEAEEYMDYAVDGASRMQDMIDALLQYARVHSKGDDPTDVDADDVLEQTVQSLEFLIEEEGATVEIGSLPAVSADESQLGQLFQNLVKNAIHHGGDEPTVTVDGHVEDDLVHLTVTDDGPGIHDSQQERIFEIFKGESEREDSTGIGLAICKRIANRHGGDLWVESTVGEGATFHVTVPPATETLEVGA